MQTGRGAICRGGYLGGASVFLQTLLSILLLHMPSSLDLLKKGLTLTLCVHTPVLVVLVKPAAAASATCLFIVSKPTIVSVSSAWLKPTVYFEVSH